MSAIDQVDNIENQILVDDYITGLDEPWGFTFLGPEKVLITEKSGTLKFAQKSDELAAGWIVSNVSGIPAVNNSRQGGLLDVATDPDYARNSWIYLTFSHPLSGTNGPSMTKLIRGKIVEIIIVGSISFFVFTAMGLQYSLLLGLLVGFSVLIPYIGATVVTIPVALIAYFQFGFSDGFGWVLLAYGIIQAIDGNVIVPVLFSEAVNLHPVAIIVAVLFFGGIWGFLGVFFAIPLATLVQAVMKAWDEVKLVQQS